MLDSGVHGWPPATAEEIDAASFGTLFAEATLPEVLLVGTGRKLVHLPPALRRALRERGIVVEVMDTGAAARTFNVLLAEGRPVGAALIAVD